MKTEKKYLMYGISLLLLTLIGVSLAYFVTEIVGSSKTVSVSTGDLRIVFTDTDGSITGNDIEPGWNTTKTFSVENKTNSSYKYNIVIEDLVNTFNTTGYLVYKITSTDGGYNMTDYVDVPKSSSAKDVVLAYSVTIPSKTIHSYTIELKYINDEDNSQNIDMNSKLSGNVYIGVGTVPLTLEEAIIRDNPNISTRNDFSVTNTSNTTGTLFTTNQTEDDSTVYYYSGNTTNNWVYFGGFYWRIIRTNEDGSVRLLYAGTSYDTTEGYIGHSAFNTGRTDSRYLGYMYGGNTSLEDNRTNTTNSTIKDYIDSWYQNNLLTNYDKYISKTAIYCNDRSVDSSKYTWSSNGSYFEIGVYSRLNNNNVPSYKCGADASGGLYESTQAIEDKFSVSTTGGGNGELTYPVALMTADEVSFAGGVMYTPLMSPYAYYYTNALGESITSTSWWWLLSPGRWYGEGLSILEVNASDNPGLLDVNSDYNTNAVRPVISISSCTKVTGIGTPEDPYIIDMVNSTC